jgi:hypothetical protein
MGNVAKSHILTRKKIYLLIGYMHKNNENKILIASLKKKNSIKEKLFHFISFF